MSPHPHDESMLLCVCECEHALVLLLMSEPEASVIPGAHTITWYKIFHLNMKLLLGEFSPKAKKHKNSSPPLCMAHYTEIEDSMFEKLSFL